MIAEFISRAKYVLAAEGPLSLVVHAAKYAFGFIFRFDVYAIRRHYPALAADLDKAKFMPGVEGCELFIVKDNADADAMESKGYEFRSCIFRGGEALKNGGTALAVFCKGKIASIAWVAHNARVQKIFENPPGKISYETGGALICGTATFPGFRRRGLYIYTLFKTLEYLAASGNSKCTTYTDLRLPIGGISERLFGSSLAGYGYRLRILGIQFYWEKPVKKMPVRSSN